MRIGITGSSGFIGSELTKHLSAKGHQILLLQRKAPEVLPIGTTFHAFDISNPDTIPDTTGLDALVHTAYMPFANNHSSEQNIHATLALSAACAKTNTQFIFLSSMSAHEQALSEYGKHKFALEQKLPKANTLILKLGLVLGEKGLYSRIKQTVAKSKIIPLIGGGTQPVQILFIRDLVSLIEKCIQQKTKGVYCIATPGVYTMKELFQHIAAQSGAKPIFIPLPYFIAGSAIALIQFLRLPFPVSKENLLGLKQMKAQDTSADLKFLQIELTPLPL